MAIVQGFEYGPPLLKNKKGSNKLFWRNWGTLSRGEGGQGNLRISFKISIASRKRY